MFRKYYYNSGKYTAFIEGREEVVNLGIYFRGKT